MGPEAEKLEARVYTSALPGADGVGAAAPGALASLGAPLVAATSLPGADGGLATAAAVAVAAARRGGDQPRGVVLAEVSAAGSRRRRPTLVSSAAARTLETALRGNVSAAARGALAWVALDPAHEWRDELDFCRSSGPAVVVVHALPELWRELVEAKEAGAAVLQADVASAKPLAALAAIELIGHGMPTAVVGRAPGLVATRRALAGIEPGGDLGARARRIAARLLPEVEPEAKSSAARAVRPTRRRASRAPSPGEAGQALPLMLGLTLVMGVAGLALALLGAAATGASRFQRAADLGAVSAARSLRDDHHRLFVPATLPGGLPNPAHLSDPEYRERAVGAAHEALDANGVEGASAEITFPRDGFAPTRVRVELEGTPALDGEEASDAEIVVAAVAEAYPVAEGAPGRAAAPATASGGGYSGRLAYRQGEGMRPDVAGAFDAMAAAAAQAGHSLLVNSGFRSDAEQATLFAANPDPRMVAPPGTSLHRCATELDLGPSSAYGWLAANAERFGFLKRYPWEAWHFGYTAGPAPCSSAGDRVASAAGRGGDGAGSATGLPSFVPERFRDPITRAASRWNVPGAVLAAQLLAESGFNPFAVSPVGASGIAQFMPGTATAYGLRDPFDPDAAIDAQAHLMSDLLAQFGQVPLALAAYNAGPTPVAACDCVPPYPETQAYVARIMGLLGGVGAVAPPTLEVRLVG